MNSDNTAVAACFTTKELPYAYDALAPQISEETLRYHHDKHYAGYVAKLNELIAGMPQSARTLEDIIRTADGPIFNNAAQIWNHEFFFDQFAAQPQNGPSGAFAKAVARDFGSFDAMWTEMSRASAALFGSGWIWLVDNGRGRLGVIGEPNAGNPLRLGMVPLLCLDVWEHAYYIDYRNRRADAVAAFWKRIDWKTVDLRYEKACSMPGHGTGSK